LAGMINHPAGWAFVGMSLVYLSNISDLFGVPIQYRVLWSLAVEEHFYLLWPACVRKLRLRGTAIAAGTVCLLALGCRSLASRLGHDPFGTATWLVADGLGMGALIAVAARAFRESKTALWLLTAAAFLLAAGCFLIDRVVGHTLAGGALHITAYNSFCMGIVITTLQLGRRYTIRQPLLEFFGNISYGLYLVHMLCFDFYDHVMPKIWPVMANGKGHFGVMVFRFVVGGGLAVGIATVSRRFYEDPILRLKERLAPSPKRTQTQLDESSSITPAAWSDAEMAGFASPLG
jgi:peptidoglycan/LPS O-acetylase OafA/YrhL